MCVYWGDVKGQGCIVAACKVGAVSSPSTALLYFAAVRTELTTRWVCDCHNMSGILC